MRAFSLMLAFTALATSAPAATTTTLKSKFFCFGLPGSQISVTVKITDDTATAIKWKGKNLAPSTRVQCGYACAFGGSTQVFSCLETDAAGKWKYTSEDAAPLACDGLTPTVRLPDAGTTCSFRIE